LSILRANSTVKPCIRFLYLNTQLILEIDNEKQNVLQPDNFLLHIFVFEVLYMKKLYEARLFLYSLGLSISSLLERAITYYITTAMGLDPTNAGLDPIKYHTISMILLIMLFIGTNLLIKNFTKSGFVFKFIFGKEYVAGRWLETTYSPESQECKIAIGYCCFDIMFDEDGISIDGTNYDLNLNVNYTLTSRSASINDYELKYMFLRNVDGVEKPDWGRIKFQKNYYSRPTTYIGNFEREGIIYGFKGVLISDKKDIQLLDEDFIGNFKKVLVKYNRTLPKEV